jgi:hypothetical protein
MAKKREQKKREQKAAAQHKSPRVISIAHHSHAPASMLLLAALAHDALSTKGGA